MKRLWGALLIYVQVFLPKRDTASRTPQAYDPPWRCVAVVMLRNTRLDKPYLSSSALSNVAGVTQPQAKRGPEALFHDVLSRYDDTVPRDYLNVGVGDAPLGNALLTERSHRGPGREPHRL